MDVVKAWTAMSPVDTIGVGSLGLILCIMDASG